MGKNRPVFAWKVISFVMSRTSNAIRNYFWSRYKSTLKNVLVQTDCRKLVDDELYMLDSKKLFKLVRKRKFSLEEITAEKILQILKDNIDEVKSLKPKTFNQFLLQMSRRSRVCTF